MYYDIVKTVPVKVPVTKLHFDELVVFGADG